MNAADGLQDVPLLLTGLVLIARWGAMSARRPDFRRWGDRIERIHDRAGSMLVDRGIFRFPGSAMGPFRGAWILGETALAVSFPLFLTAASSPAARILSLPASCLVGTTVLYIAHRGQARKRLAALGNSLPLASFLISLFLEGGLGTYSALGETTAALPEGPLRRELADIVRSRSLGVPRDEALEKSRRRVPLDDYRIFLNLVQQGERLGIGLSRALRDHGAKMLESQGHRAETIAQQAPVKLLFPLVVFIFPSVFLVILSPVILNLFQTLAG